MKKETFKFHGGNHKVIEGIVWSPETQPNAVVHIVHGMTEHIGRYEDFADELVKENIAVCGFDLRGHGTNLENNCASFGHDGWQATKEDIKAMHTAIKKRFPQTPHFLLGFSLGSFIAREYIDTYPEDFSGAVIMGTGHQPASVLSIMCAIVKGQIKKSGFDRTTPLVKKLSFESYNNNFKPNRTASDWLCSDSLQLDRYIDDPFCRENISSGLFYQLLTAMKSTGHPAAYSNTDKDMPLLLISGGDDPVGGSGKGVTQAEEIMKKAGMRRITKVIFAGARHDLLHETAGGQAKKATETIINWIKTNK